LRRFRTVFHARYRTLPDKSAGRTARPVDLGYQPGNQGSTQVRGWVCQDFLSGLIR